MKKVSLQVQLTGRPYLTLKIADCCGRKSSPSRLGEEGATLLCAGSHQRRPGIFIPFQRHGAQYLIPERPFTHFDGWLKDQLTGAWCGHPPHWTGGGGAGCSDPSWVVVSLVYQTQ